MLRESNTPEDKSEMTVNMNRLTAYLICALTLGITACGEEEESNVPTILNANSKAECRDDNGVMKLELVEVAILHLDGAEVMGSAQARVESSLLTMEKQAAPYQPSLNEAGEPIGLTCAVEGELCVALYSWRRRSDSEQITCDGDIVVEFDVEDNSGNLIELVLVAETASED